MTGVTRREFFKASGGVVVATAGLAGCASSTGELEAKRGRRVVVVGGGWGGATAAKYVRLADPAHRGRAARAQPPVRVLSRSATWS